MHAFAEQSWAVKAGVIMNAVLGLKEFVCDSDEQSWAVKAGVIMNAVLGLK